ncbi:hypothetical protein PM082_011730 [Marasmius tenuissimus]|nr:hypothetical protein PM082_011730 [Marasmius tenuissimus]
MDDIHSFFWCFLWTILFNDSDPPLYPRNLNIPLRSLLKSPQCPEREYVSSMIFNIAALNEAGPCWYTTSDDRVFHPANRTDMSPFLYGLSPVLQGLYEDIGKRTPSWYRSLRQLREQGGESFDSLYLLTSLSFTFGVLGDFLDVLTKTPQPPANSE